MVAHLSSEPHDLQLKPDLFQLPKPDLSQLPYPTNRYPIPHNNMLEGPKAATCIYQASTYHKDADISNHCRSMSASVRGSAPMSRTST